MGQAPALVNHDKPKRNGRLMEITKSEIVIRFIAREFDAVSFMVEAAVPAPSFDLNSA